MIYMYPAYIIDKPDVPSIVGHDISFDENGYLIDPDLSIQKTIEDTYQAPVISIQQSTRKDSGCIIFYDPNGYVQTNPMNGNRMAAIAGPLEDLKSEITVMVNEHPTVSPKLLLDSYTYHCTPPELLALRKWMKETFSL